MAHQREAFDRFKDDPYFGLFIEQRGGKTAIALNVFRRHYESGTVDALIWISYPNGTQHVVRDELVKDFPPDLLARTKIVTWVSGKMTTGKRREEVLALRDYRAGPVVLAMNCEAIITKAGWKYLEWFVARRRVMLVADESSWMANFSARTRKALVLSRKPNVVVKAILDGTPCEEGVGELYFQTSFLKPGVLGFATKDAFKARYFEYEEEEIPETRGVVTVCPNCSGRDGNCVICGGMGTVEGEEPTGVVVRRRVRKQRHGPGGRVLSEYEVFKGYRNLGELEHKLKTFSVRVRRADISDAPPKVYQSRYFELTPAQRKVYDDLRTRYVAELEGGQVRAANVLLRMTRLQMIARGYLPPETEGIGCERCAGSGWVDDGECDRCAGLGIAVRTTDLRRIDPTRNPAVDALKDELAANRGEPAVVWCRFRQDVLDCVAAVGSLGLNFYRYDGGVPEPDREASYQAFRRGEGDGIIATIGSGLQRGKDLSRAGMLIYYSNDFSLRSRRQSEDRAEGLNRKRSTGVIDLVAADTRDLQVIEALRAKRSIADLILGDPPSKWI